MKNPLTIILFIITISLGVWLYINFQDNKKTDLLLKNNNNEIILLHKENLIYKHTLDSLYNEFLKHKNDIAVIELKLDSLYSVNDSLMVKLRKTSVRKPYKPKTDDELYDYLLNYKPVY